MSKMEGRIDRVIAGGSGPQVLARSGKDKNQPIEGLIIVKG